MQTINIGFVGAGRAKELHVNAYKKVYGYEVVDKATYTSSGRNATVKSFDELISNPEIDIIDICTPPYVHKEEIIAALKAGKNVICEKPLTGCFDTTLSKKQMYTKLKKDIAEIERAVNSAKGQFFYAENFVYAPSIQRAAEIIKARKSKILFAKGEESLKGSSSPVAGLWEKTGGGTFIRTGTHPLAAILYLKAVESEAQKYNASIQLQSVVADMGCVTKALNEKEHRAIAANPKNVEDLSVATYSFSDGSKAVVMAEDVLLGGSRNYVELYCNDAVLNCTLTLTNQLQTYLPDEQGMKGVELSEMLPVKTGWNNAFVDDENQRGYVSEMQDFIECAATGRKPLSGFKLAKDTALAVYAAYAAAETNKRFEF